MFARRLAVLSVLLLSFSAGATTKTWTGGGGDLLWSNAANWSDRAVPANGDALVFGAVTTVDDVGGFNGLALSSIAIDLDADNWTKERTYITARARLSLRGTTLVLHPVRIFPGQTHTIIRNEGAIDGTFDGLPEGEWFAPQGPLYRITYRAGSGRDVAVLTPFITGTWLRTSEPSATFGAPVTLTAHVIAWGVAPVGVVDFLDGATQLGSATIDEWQNATLTTTALTSGAHAITAAYRGTDLFDPKGLFSPSTSDALPLTIAEAPMVATATELDVRTQSAVVLRASVHAASGLPQGVVEFLDHSVWIGSANIEADQTASLSLPSLAPGVHLLTAVYLGANGYGVSTSAPVQLMVPPPSPSSHRRAASH